LQKLLVREIVQQTAEIKSFELVHPEGRELAPFTAGAHVDVHVPGGLCRQYSLCNDPRQRRRYLLGVLNVRDGRGGSAAMHSRVAVGDMLEVSAPRNHFPVCHQARRHLLIAGGIGITPILAMVHELRNVGASFAMHFCTRSPAQTPFLRELAPLIDAGIVRCHYDGGDCAKGLDVRALLRVPMEGTHVYCCGPAGLMTAVAEAGAHWPQGSVHFEHFKADAPPATLADDSDFVIQLARSGVELPVPKGKSIVHVLREAGFNPETSCESGLCGTCKTRYLEGAPEHHDYVLSTQERAEYLMVCCARSKSLVLVLDL